MIEEGPHSQNLTPAQQRALLDQGIIGYDKYTPGLGHRYGSDPMQENWSQTRLWGNVRKVWYAVAQVQNGVGLVSDEQLADLRDNLNNLSVSRILGLERISGHDVNGAIEELREVAPKAAAIVHNGMTSEDVLSNAENMQIREGFRIIRAKTVSTLRAFGENIEDYKDLPCVAYTHLRSAEPTTFGYRLAKYAQGLLTGLQFMDVALPLIRSKGIKGAVGTSASFKEILEGTPLSPEDQERSVMEKLGLPCVTISDQTYPRQFLFMTQAVLANLAIPIHEFNFNFQLLQSSFIDEVAEPRRRGQVGSSAMPHKQNPVNSENASSLALAPLGGLITSWIVASTVWMERTLRDSGVKRDDLPASFFAVDEALSRTERVVRGMRINRNAIASTLRRESPFFATESLLAQLTLAGMNRLEAHQLLVGHSEIATEAVRNGKRNPMRKLVLGDDRIVSVLGRKKIEKAFRDAPRHIGDAPERCTKFLEEELYPYIGKN